MPLLQLPSLRLSPKSSVLQAGDCQSATCSQVTVAVVLELW